MPDIDMDFEDSRRQDVIDYVVNKYGRDYVAQVATFGTMAARGAIRDCGRAMNKMPSSEIDRLCKMIPTIPVGVKIDQAMTLNPEFKAAYDNNPQAKELIDTAKRLEGLTRHDSVHAAAIIISAEPLIEHTPLQKSDDGIGYVTQYPAGMLEKIGLLKMDFLGLANLTILSKTVKNIKKNCGIDINVLNLPLDDRKTYELLGRGDCSGVFQLEGPQMRRYIADLRPNTVAEVAAMVALYRPGPMAQIPKYIRCKHGMDEIEYMHPALEPILAESYGVIVYQDQVLRIVQAIAGFSLGQADILRKAMGKKVLKEMVQQRENFLNGAVKKGLVDREQAEEIFDLIEPFAGYAFNKAHAFCYAMIAYQTAYLKANYPVEYFAALMATQAGDTEKLVAFVEDAKRTQTLTGHTIEILPPDVNKSMAEFAFEGEDIRFGLTAIKSIGKAPVEAILAARSEGPFTSLYDFCARVQARGLTSKSNIEGLIKAGALACFDTNRSKLLLGLDAAFTSASVEAKNKRVGQGNMFDMGDDSDNHSAAPPLPDVPPPHPSEITAMEKEMFGFYLSEHPLDQYLPSLKNQDIRTIAECRTLPDRENVNIAGVLTLVKPRYTKTENKLMYSMTLEDKTGSISVTVFPKAAAEMKSPPEVDTVVIIQGKTSHRDQITKNMPQEDEAVVPAANVEIQANKILHIAGIADAAQQEAANQVASAASLHIRIRPSMQDKLSSLHQSLIRYKGDGKVVFHVTESNGRERCFKPNINVVTGRELVGLLGNLLGDTQSVWLE
jgi:DNA polymerase-3 subunit alpha